MAQSRLSDRITAELIEQRDALQTALAGYDRAVGLMRMSSASDLIVEAKNKLHNVERKLQLRGVA